MRNISAKKLKKLGGKVPFSSITSPKKPIPKSNSRQQAKRKAGYRKMLSGKEYKAARAEAMKRAGNRCEWRWGPFEVKPGFAPRCIETENLHAHHLSYPKTRLLDALDLLILCKWHHEYFESQKMGKVRMF